MGLNKLCYAMLRTNNDCCTSSQYLLCIAMIWLVCSTQFKKQEYLLCWKRRQLGMCCPLRWKADFKLIFFKSGSEWFTMMMTKYIHCDRFYTMILAKCWAKWVELSLCPSFLFEICFYSSATFLLFVFVAFLFQKMFKYALTLPHQLSLFHHCSHVTFLQKAMWLQ